MSLSHEHIESKILNLGRSYLITTVQIKASEPIVRFLSESKGSEH